MWGIIEKLQRMAGWGITLAVFAFVTAAMAWINLADAPLTVPRFERITQGLPLLDLVSGYTPDEAYSMLTG